MSVRTNRKSKKIWIVPCDKRFIRIKQLLVQRMRIWTMHVNFVHQIKCASVELCSELENFLDRLRLLLTELIAGKGENMKAGSAMTFMQHLRKNCVSGNKKREKKIVRCARVNVRRAAYLQFTIVLLRCTSFRGHVDHQHDFVLEHVEFLHDASSGGAVAIELGHLSLLHVELCTWCQNFTPANNVGQSSE